MGLPSAEATAAVQPGRKTTFAWTVGQSWPRFPMPSRRFVTCFLLPGLLSSSDPPDHHCIRHRADAVPYRVRNPQAWGDGPSSSPLIPCIALKSVLAHYRPYSRPSQPSSRLAYAGLKLPNWLVPCYRRAMAAGPVVGTGPTWLPESIFGLLQTLPSWGYPVECLRGAPFGWPLHAHDVRAQMLQRGFKGSPSPVGCRVPPVSPDPRLRLHLRHQRPSNYTHAPRLS